MVEENNLIIKNRFGSVGPPLGRQISNSNSPIQALFLSLINSANIKNASQIHFYLKPNRAECYFKILDKLTKAPKTFSPKVLSELTEHLKNLANLELSPQKLAQNAKLNLPDGQVLNLNLTQNPEAGELHLTLNLTPNTKPRSLEELGFSSSNLAKLNSILQKQSGIILLDSLDSQASYELTNTLLVKLKSQNLRSSLEFNSSFFEDYNHSAHSRIFAKLNSENLPIAKQALLAETQIIILADPLDNLSLELALNLANSGKLVMVNTRAGSASSSLKKTLSLANSPTALLNQLLFTVSLRPIQALATPILTSKVSGEILTQLEDFFGITSQQDWQTFLNLSGAYAQNPSNLELVTSTKYFSLTNLVELLIPDEDFKLSLINRPQTSSEVITWMAIQDGMLTFRHDGLIKALQKELNISDVISTCSY